MTTATTANNNDNTYFDSIKSYFMGTSGQSIFTPIVKRAFDICTAFVTGITETCVGKTTKEAVQVALDHPVQTACLTATAACMGTVMINYPVPSIITLVAISFMLLNKKLKTKINTAYEICKDLVTPSFINVLGNLNFKNVDSPRKIKNVKAGNNDVMVNDHTSNPLHADQNQVKTNDNSSSSSLLNQVDLARLYFNFEKLNLSYRELQKDNLKIILKKAKYYPNNSFIYSPSNYYPDKNLPGKIAGKIGKLITKKPPQVIQLGNHKISLEASKISKFSEIAIMKLTKALLKAI